jgi:4-alpha-methyl-delta7-sterol-4alpha-methyl oxidase
MVLGGNAHCFMLIFWQVWKIFISSEGHCGFEFPFSPTRILPLVSGASYHDWHHSKNVGNFAGSVYLWDTIMGTNHVYFEQVMGKRAKKN